MRFLRRLSTALLPLGFAASLTAQTTINFLFTSEGSYQGASARPGSSSSEFWNVLGGSPDIPQTTDNLRDISGATTSISVSQATSFDTDLSLGGLPNSGLPVFTSYAHSNGAGEVKITIGGLEDQALYSIYVYAARDLNSRGQGTSEFNEINFGVDASLQTAYTDTQTSVFMEGVNYVYLADILVEKSGYISFTVSGIINGFTLVSGGESAVPEPSTYAAMAGGIALGFSLWRRRSRRA